MILGIGFPNPIGWVIDKVTGFVGGAATDGFEPIIGGLTAWVVDAVVWVVGGVFNFFLDSTDPTSKPTGSSPATAPTPRRSASGRACLLLFVLAGIIQARSTATSAGCFVASRSSCLSRSSG